MYYMLSNMSYPVLEKIPYGSRITKYLKSIFNPNPNYAYVHIFDKKDDGTYVFLCTKKNYDLIY